MRLRFDKRELTLLKGAEEVRGRSLAHTPRPDQLRSALTLAKAGQKIGHAQAGSSISFDEGEANLLLEALRYATDELQRAGSPGGQSNDPKRKALLEAFPELVERGTWRTFGLSRELEALAARLRSALNSDQH